MTIIKDGWKLVGGFRWEPVVNDIKETCNSCLGRGRGMFDEDDCEACSGNGFRYIVHPRGEQPEIPKHLLYYLRDAYLEWE